MYEFRRIEQPEFVASSIVVKETEDTKAEVKKKDKKVKEPKNVEAGEAQIAELTK